MSDDRFEILRRIVLETSRLPKEDREAFLESEVEDPVLRSEVRELLAADDLRCEVLRTGALVDAAAGLVGSADEDTMTGKQLGRYRLHEQIGQGGMGVVYRATQAEPIRREVAVKILRQDVSASSLLRRFEHERELLAQLDHPGIAQVLDAGQTESGLPYFVLEFVSGISITEYCRENSLDGRDRTKLFLQVCQAVDHAHRRGVIHRDLKPSNILVQRRQQGPHVKIIDFGVARALTDSSSELSMATLDGHVLGTPQYMSPEQARGDRQRIDVRSDVYALGVILHELMTGSLPYDVDTTSALQVLGAVARSEISPVRRDFLGRDLSPDLVTIVSTALDPDPERRYSSVSSLGADLERLLAHRPIHARAPSLSYQLRKASQRHPVVTGLLALLLLVVLGAVAGMAVLLQSQRKAEREARAAAAEAQDETRKAERINDFLQELLASARPDELGIDVTVREVLEGAGETLEQELEEEPEIRAAVHHTLGKTFAELGLFDEADQHLRQALDLRLDRGGEPTLDLAQNLDDVAEVHWYRREYAAAVELLQRGLDIRQLLLDEESIEVAQSLHNLGSTLSALGRHAEGDSMTRRALEIRRSIHGDDHASIASSLNNLGTSLLQAQRPEEALPYLEEAAQMRRRLLGMEHPDTYHAISNVAVAIRASDGDLERAKSLWREVLEAQLSSLGEDHPDVAMIHFNLGRALTDQDSLAQAQEHFRRAMVIRRERLGATHPTTWYAQRAAGRACLAQGRVETAATLARDFLDACAQGGARPGHELEAETLLARCHLRSGDLDEAGACVERAGDLVRRSNLAGGRVQALLRIADRVFDQLDQPERATALRDRILGGDQESE